MGGFYRTKEVAAVDEPTGGRMTHLERLESER
jgi:hypothetical protein